MEQHAIGLTVDDEEIATAIKFAPQLGATVQIFNDREGGEGPGRATLHLGDAVHDERFQALCPGLCRLWAVYSAATSSFCFMVTWGANCWYHCDERANKSASTSDRSMRNYRLRKQNSPGAKEVVIMNHTVALDDTRFSLSSFEGWGTHKAALSAPRVDPNKVKQCEDYVRPAGHVQCLPAWMAGGRAIGGFVQNPEFDPTVGGGLEDIEYVLVCRQEQSGDERGPRVGHAAAASGPRDVTASLLATVPNANVPLLLDALKAAAACPLPRVPDEVKEAALRKIVALHKKGHRKRTRAEQRREEAGKPPPPAHDFSSFDIEDICRGGELHLAMSSVYPPVAWLDGMAGRGHEQHGQVLAHLFRAPLCPIAPLEIYLTFP